MNKQKQQKPWLNSNGEIKTEAEIKQECKSWGLEAWNEYLQNFEAYQREDTLENPLVIENFTAQEPKAPKTKKPLRF